MLKQECGARAYSLRIFPVPNKVLIIVKMVKMQVFMVDNII